MMDFAIWGLYGRGVKKKSRQGVIEASHPLTCIAYTVHVKKKTVLIMQFVVAILIFQFSCGHSCVPHLPKETFSYLVVDSPVRKEIVAHNQSLHSYNKV